MSIIELPFIGGAYEAFSKGISSQESVNVYVEAHPEAPPALIGVPGLDVFKALGDGPIQHLSTINLSGEEFLLVVSGGVPYTVNVAGNESEITVNGGSWGNNRFPVNIVQSQTELLAKAPNGVYSAPKTNLNVSGFTLVSDVATNGVTNPGETLASIDGYGIFFKENSDEWWFTDVLDFTSVTGTNFATAEGHPDNIVAVISDHRELWLFGESTIEIWINTGDAVSPFQRLPGGFIEKGCLGKYSVAKLDNSVFWLGDDKVVYRANGIAPQRISNPGIEEILRKAENPEGAIATAYSTNGHSFYQLNLTGSFSNESGEATIVYDASTGLWHTRRSLNSDRILYEFSAQAWGDTYVAGTDNVIYRLDADVYRQGLPAGGGQALERVRTVGPLRVTDYSTLAMIRFVFETGENSDLDTAQKVFLEISDDGGKTFGNRIEASIGKRGQYQQMVEFWGLGGFDDNQRVLRLTMTDNAKYSLIGAVADVL